jgi:hypothetical protein
MTMLTMTRVSIVARLHDEDKEATVDKSTALYDERRESRRAASRPPEERVAILEDVVMCILEVTPKRSKAKTMKKMPRTRGWIARTRASVRHEEA